MRISILSVSLFFAIVSRSSECMPWIEPGPDCLRRLAKEKPLAGHGSRYGAVGQGKRLAEPILRSSRENSRTGSSPASNAWHGRAPWFAISAPPVAASTNWSAASWSTSSLSSGQTNRKNQETSAHSQTARARGWDHEPFKQLTGCRPPPLSLFSVCRTAPDRPLLNPPPLYGNLSEPRSV